MTRRFLLALALAAAAAHAAPDVTRGTTELHGVADAFANPGVALAWAVLRGPTDAATTVELRIETTAPAYAFVAADGVDPFTQERRGILPPTPVGSGLDVHIPRAHFAAFPRTEFRFFASSDAEGAVPATLVVYYLGVPDTTPEFPTAAALAAYLADRLVRERATMQEGKGR
jgi:hypothetical protein